MASVASLQLPPLTLRNMTALVAKARRMGVDPADYAKQLIEDGLALQCEAEESSFAQIMKPLREAAVDLPDNEITKLVEIARSEHYAGMHRKKR